MAYTKKYTASFATKNADTLTIELWEDGYVGSVITYPCDSYNKQYIPEGDDPFEPIYASQVSVVLDVTADLANMPDFTTLDDRKYWVKVLRGSNVDWQGWALSDDVQLNFDGDIKQVQFNAVCGLGMLQDIDFSTAVTTYRAYIWQFFIDSITKLNFPTAPNIVDFTSIFGGSMFNRVDAPQSTPWTQCYMAVNNFVRTRVDEQGITRNEFNCLDVLREILTSWGCRIFMANGEWNIVQVNQACNSTRYFTRYDGAGSYLNDGTVTGFKNIPTDAIFVEGDQLKIYKKGFNNFIGFKQIEFPDNMLFNANLKQLTAGNADFWTATVAGGGYVQVRQNQTREINSFILALGNTTTAALAQVDSSVGIPINAGDSPLIQFRVYNTTANLDGGGALLPNCILRILVAGATSTVYLADDNTWKTFTIGVTDFYRVEDKAEDTLVNLEEIPGSPIDGDLSFGVLIQGSGVNTQSAIIIGDFEISVDSLFRSVLMTAKINDTNSYRKDVVFPHGYNIEVSSLSNKKPSFLGAITDVDGNQIYGWYMQERLGTDNYFSLAHLMFQNYINMLRQNLINIDSSIYGLLTATDVMTFTDTDPAQISVTGKKYIIGSTTFDSQQNELIGTVLQTDNTHQEVTVTTVYDNGIGIGIAQNMSSNGAISGSAACAFTTYPLIKYSEQFLPVVGDVIYNDVDLTQPFMGNTIWFKFFIPYFNTTRSYRINASGVITDVSTC
jgi:hypothetical protein